MPNQRSYWETFPGYTSVSSLVSRKRFENVMSLIYFVDNNSVTEETKKIDRSLKYGVEVECLDFYTISIFTKAELTRKFQMI